MARDKTKGPKTYAPEELVDALIVDSEGYIWGYVDSVTVQKGRPVVKTYEKEVISETVTDLDELKTALLPTVKKILGKPNLDDLYRQIRKEMEVDEVTDEILEEYASKKGIRVPKKKTQKVKRKAKGTVAWKNIACINSTKLGTCMLLEVPKEASRRGVKVKGKVPYRSHEEIEPKSVIDAEGKIVGRVKGLRYNAQGPNLQLACNISIRSIDEGAVVDRILQQDDYSMNEDELYEKIADDLDLGGKQDVTPEKMVEWAKEKGYSISDEEIMKMREIKHEYIIPWRDIRKIGDVVLLEKTIDEIIGEEWKPLEELEESREEGAAAEAPAAEPNVCQSCGTVNEPSAKYCRKCGAKLRL